MMWELSAEFEALQRVPKEQKLVIRLGSVSCEGAPKGRPRGGAAPQCLSIGSGHASAFAGEALGGQAAQAIPADGF